MQRGTQDEQERKERGVHTAIISCRIPQTSRPVMSRMRRLPKRTTMKEFAMNARMEIALRTLDMAKGSDTFAICRK